MRAQVGGIVTRSETDPEKSPRDSEVQRGGSDCRLRCIFVDFQLFGTAAFLNHFLFFTFPCLFRLLVSHPPTFNSFVFTRNSHGRRTKKKKMLVTEIFTDFIIISLRRMSLRANNPFSVQSISLSVEPIKLQIRNVFHQKVNRDPTGSLFPHAGKSSFFECRLEPVRVIQLSSISPIEQIHFEYVKF